MGAPASRARSMAWPMREYSATLGRASLQAPRSARPLAVSSVSSTSMMSMSSQWTMQMPGAPRSAQNRSERSTIPASDGPPSQESPSVGRGLYALKKCLNEVTPRSHTAGSSA